MRNALKSTLALCLTALIAVIGCSPDVLAEVSVDEVLEKYIEAVGGRDAVEKLASREATGRVTTDLTSRELPVYIVKGFQAYGKLPDKSVIVHLVDGTYEKNGFDGARGWTSDRCGVKRNDRDKPGKLDWLLNPQSALRIKEYFPGLTYTGVENFSGHSVHVLETAERDKAYYALKFDIETGLLVGLGNYWELSDWREVDGVLFPHKIATSRKGGSTVYEFDSIRHNMPLDDSLFSAPEESGN